MVERKDQFEDLMELKDRIARDDYVLNRRLRANFRVRNVLVE